MKNIPTYLIIASVSASALAAFLLYSTYGDHNRVDTVATQRVDFSTPPSIAAASATSTFSPVKSVNSTINTVQSQNNSFAANDVDVADMNPNYPTLEYRLTEMKARRDGEQFDAEKVKAVLAMSSAWNEDVNVASTFSGKDANQEDGRAFIRYEPLRVEALMPGDELMLPVPQEHQEFHMVVDTVEAHGDGVVTWRGHLTDFTEQNQVTISQAKGNTQMGIFTPEGHYQVEVFGTQGWVVNSGHLFRGGDVVINVTDGVEGPAVYHGEHGETTE